MIYEVVEGTKKVSKAILKGAIRLYLLKELVGSWRTAGAIYFTYHKEVNAVSKWFGL